MLELEDIDFDEDLREMFIISIAEDYILKLGSLNQMAADTMRNAFEETVDSKAKYDEAVWDDIEEHFAVLVVTSDSLRDASALLADVIILAFNDLTTDFINDRQILSAGNGVDEHNNIIKNLSMILDYKILNEHRFGNPDKIMEELSEKDLNKFLFNVDVLR
jgi:hypothetical protein